MPIAGSDQQARMYAHVRCAGRYAKAEKIDKAIAHFGRALEYGAGTSEASKEEAYVIYVRIYVSKRDKENLDQHQSLLSRIDISTQAEAAKLIEGKAHGYAREFADSGYTSAIPTLKLEFYDVTEEYKRGAYVDARKSDGAAIDEHTKAYQNLVSGISVIVPAILKEVYGPEPSHEPDDAAPVIQGIEVTKQYEYTIDISYLTFGSTDLYSHIWKANAAGKLRRRLVDEAGLYAHVRPLNGIKDTSLRKRTIDGATRSSERNPTPKRIVVVLSRTRAPHESIERSECERVADKKGPRTAKSAKSAKGIILDELRLLLGDKLIADEIVFIGTNEAGEKNCFLMSIIMGEIDPWANQWVLEEQA